MKTRTRNGLIIASVGAAIIITKKFVHIKSEKVGTALFMVGALAVVFGGAIAVGSALNKYN